MSIDNALDDAREAATDLLNADGRHPGHVLLGVVSCRRQRAGREDRGRKGKPGCYDDP